MHWQLLIPQVQTEKLPKVRPVQARQLWLHTTCQWSLQWVHMHNSAMCVRRGDCCSGAALTCITAAILHNDGSGFALLAEAFGSCCSCSGERMLIGWWARAAVLILPLQRLQHAEAVHAGSSAIFNLAAARPTCSLASALESRNP